MKVGLKRVYEAPAPEDGARVLVDRLWPRGLKKEDAALDAWMKDVAPSTELRKWAHAHPEQWEKFCEKYLDELTSEPAHDCLRQLYEMQRARKRLTLLFASKDTEHNNAVVLKHLVEGHRKPPKGTGPRWSGHRRPGARCAPPTAVTLS